MRTLLICLLLAAVAGTGGCKNSSNKNKNNGTPDLPAKLPLAFEDSFGETWTCLNADEDDQVSGKVSLTRPVGNRNADILHISLLEIRANGSVSLVANGCINNIQSWPVNYQLGYNHELIDPAARYMLSAVFFIRLPEGTYMAAYRPDGFLEVINNKLVEKADLFLKVPG